MGVNLKYGTAGATGGGWSAQPGSLQPVFEESWSEPKWSWQARSPKTWKDPNRWVSLWPSMGTGCLNGGGDGMGTDGTVSNWGQYEPFSCDGPGTQSMNFLRGTCKDSVGTPVANAIVQAFVTSTDAFAGEVQGNTDGTYTLGVQQSKLTTHYLVAYKSGSPDTAGTTVNTLLPTNVDGT